MQKIKTFFLTFFRSLTDPVYYNDVIRARSEFSLKYFLSFYLFLSLLVVATITLTILPKLPQTIDEGLNSVLTLFPDNLEVTLNIPQSEISVAGASEPIIIPLPKSDNMETDLENLLVIDTSASVVDFDRYNSAILLTRTDLIALANEGQVGYQVMPLKDLTAGFKSEDSSRSITSLTLNKDFLNSNVPLIKKLADQIIKFAPFFLLPIFILGYIISRLLFLAFMTLLTYLLSQLSGKDLSYGKLFQIGLHTITVTDAITKLQQLVYQSPIPMLYSFAFLGITFIALLGITTPKKTSVA